MKYHIVTGVERSGTSCMMGALRESGIPVAGWKYPFEIKHSTWTNLSCGSPEPIADDQRRLNPGFWEITEVLKHGINTDVYDGALMKIPCSGLMKSNPQYINKAIFMRRDTNSIARSMSKLPNGKKYTHIHFCNMIEERLKDGFQWLEENRIPTLFIQYEKLMLEPSRLLRKVIKFLGRGDYRWGAKFIRPQLDHSKGIECVKVG